MTVRLSRPMRAIGMRALAWLVAGAVPLSPLSTLAAQLPGVPAAPGAFLRPGVAVAANAGLESRANVQLGATGVARTTRATYGGAVGFAPAGARWQLAGGFAAQGWGDGYRNPATAVGGRATWALVRGARFGAAAVGGVGFSRARLDAPADPAIADSEDVVLLRQLPVGAVVGVRGALGTRAWALSVAPQYVWYRLSYGDDAVSAARARVGVLAEAALTPRLGLSVALEDGARASGGDPGPRGTTVGFALSFALGGR